MLTQKAFGAVLWSGVDLLLRQGLQFGISVALARLLTPEDFGTIALLSLFLGISRMFIEGGLSTALVQRNNQSHEDESTVFWFNIGVGALVSVLLILFAPTIAAFFDKPILVPLATVSALNLFVGSFSAVQNVLLIKRLAFRKLMIIGVVATVASGMIGVVMAAKGYGVWALAFQSLASTTISTACLWALSGWRPKFVFSRESARQLFGFSGYMLGAGFLEILYDRAFTVIIGKFHGVRELAFYSRADNTKHIPTDLLTGILGRVAFPLFSAAADDPDRLRRGLRMALRGVMFINVPTMIGLLAVADPFVRLVFGDAWLPSVPILRVLCVGALLWPMQVINQNVLLAQGHSRLFFRLELVKRTIGIAFITVGAFYGVIGLAWSQVAFSAAAFVINAHYSKKFLGFGWFPQVLDSLPSFLIGGSMGIVVAFVGRLSFEGPLTAIMSMMFVGAVWYLSVALLVRPTIVKDILRMSESRLKRAEPGA